MTPEVFHSSEPNKENEPMPHYDAIIVAPGFASNSHPSGLKLDTRLRLLAASLSYKNGLTESIIVGGGKLKGMPESFATLMKNRLVDIHHVPEHVVGTEEETFDTGSQVNWVQQNILPHTQNIAFMTDSEQRNHFIALLHGYQIPSADVLAAEETIIKLTANNPHAEKFLNNLHRSTYWKYWKTRERILTLLTETKDPKGEKLSKLTGRRKTNG